MREAWNPDEGENGMMAERTNPILEPLAILLATG